MTCELRLCERIIIVVIVLSGFDFNMIDNEKVDIGCELKVCELVIGFQ